MDFNYNISIIYVASNYIWLILTVVFILVFVYNSTVPSSPPRNVKVTSVKPASLMVSWQPPFEIHHNGPLTGYVIQYTRGDIMNDIFTRGTTLTISRLVALVDYSVRVAARNANGTGPFSNPVVQRSGENGKLGVLLLYGVYVRTCIVHDISH